MRVVVVAAAHGCQQALETRLWNAAEYAERSERVHRVLGAFILATILAWTPAVVPHELASLCRGRKRPQTDDDSVATAHVLAGCSTACAGLYLFAWVSLLSDDPGLWSFVAADLVQRQHLSIAALLVAAGACDLFSAKRHSAWPHSLYFANMATAGLIFLAHPQRTLGLAARHSAVGVGLVFGAFFLHCEKKKRFRAAKKLWASFPPQLDDATNLDIAFSALCFTLSAATLLHFQEEYPDTAPLDRHVSTLARCHHGAYLAGLGLFLAVATLLLLALELLRPTMQDLTHVVWSSGLRR